LGKGSFWMLNLVSLIALPLLTSMLGSGGIVSVQNTNTLTQTITVTNANDDINGDTSNTATLLANPGVDGISLPEAILAVENTNTNAIIVFNPTLRGSIINLTQTLPAIMRDGLTINGDIDGDGVPDITLEGEGKNFQALQIQGASHVVIEGLHFSNFGAPEIEISTIPQQDVHLMEDISLRHNTFTNCNSGAIDIVHHQDHAVIRDIEIMENTFQNNHFGIKLTGGFTENESDNEISSVSIISNTLAAAGFSADIFITATAGENISHNKIKDIQISNNHIHDHANPPILISAANSPNSNDNVISNITITENQIDGTPVTMELLSVGLGANAARNVLTDVIITDNILTGGGIQFSGATGTDAHDNVISRVLIDRNEISECDNGVSLYAGTGGSHHNLLENVILRNSLITKCSGAGVLLHGDDDTSQYNAINNVTITNLTLVMNGINSGWAGGININSLDISNTITGVIIANTILWNNDGKDTIQGSLAPASVINSILNDERFQGNGNFYQNPIFVDPASGNYHLQPDSPGIDSGDSSTVDVGTLDLDKKNRLWDAKSIGHAVVDRGAYELNSLVPPEFARKSPGTQIYGCLITLAIVIVLVLVIWILKKKQ
jgi:peroxiredoxin family protein